MTHTHKKQIYMAPLEGITKYIYRNAHQQVFGNITKYFAPFIDARINRPLKSRELHDLLPENNQNLSLIPQIMTNDSEAFLATAKQLEEIGYHELNLNLGCPSLTVVRKNRGAGFLSNPETLKQFFQNVYEDSSFASKDMKLSVKTRLGMESPEEMHTLIAIYNAFPLHELIIHPRVQTDYYRNTPDLDSFAFIQKESHIPLVYNGDLNTVSDVAALSKRFPDEHTLMLGRGLIRNPALSRELSSHEINYTEPAAMQNTLTKKEFLTFHDTIFHGYQELLSGEIPVLHKMKELWSYWIFNFKDAKKPYKALNKSQHFKEYETQVNILFENHFR
ncbi:MAG: tRNA-dihydrouridine synthase family protein [Hespellia sp.]|nr:tRNA-dihydrouridine synthase family protein [Hespellia sp.]